MQFVFLLHKNWSFPLRISSEIADLATFTEEILNRKLHFLCSEVLLCSMFCKLFIKNYLGCNNIMEQWHLLFSAIFIFDSNFAFLYSSSIILSLNNLSVIPRYVPVVGHFTSSFSILFFFQFLFDLQIFWSPNIPISKSKGLYLKRWAGTVRRAGLPRWDLTFLKKLL